MSAMVRYSDAMSAQAITVDTLSKFIRRFEQTLEGEQQKAAAEFAMSFASLRSAYQPLQRDAAERFKCIAPDFNIFRVLRLGRKEVITHSPILAHLLDATASHAQKTVFLRAFLDRPSVAERLGRRVNAHAIWQVRTESVT